jgi:hypothetical protein
LSITPLPQGFVVVDVDVVVVVTVTDVVVVGGTQLPLGSVHFAQTTCTLSMSVFF